MFFYEKDYGPWRPVVEKNVRRFLDCGIFHQGFARVRCRGCGSEYILAFSCKTRYFCPSCQAKRVAAFVEWVTEQILEPVEHRQYVWTIPKVLRSAFRRDRRVLGELARCAWQTLREYAKATVGEDGVPGAILAIQSYGDKLNWNPHIHALVSDSAWNRNGISSRTGRPDPQVLTSLFRQHVLEMMVSQRRLSPQFAHQLRSWRHSGFQVYCSRPVAPDDQPALERLTAYILRPSFAGSRVCYHPENGQVEYGTAKGLTCSLDVLDWIVLVTSHIPDHHEHLLRYYGRYSNASRGKRRKKEAPGALHPTHGETQREEDSEANQFSHERRRNWARLLKKIYEVDSLTCSQCGSRMEIIASIEQPQVIRKILQHLALWKQPQRSSPPRLFPHKLEAFLASLTPQQAQQIRASTHAVCRFGRFSRPIPHVGNTPRTDSEARHFQS